MKRFFVVICLCFLPLQAWAATINLTDLGTGQYRIDADPITFQVTDFGGNPNRVIIPNFWLPYAGTGLSFHISGGVNVSINGAPSFFVETETSNGTNPLISSGLFARTTLIFNYGLNYNNGGNPTVNIGDTVTVSASFIFQPSTGFSLSDPTVALAQDIRDTYDVFLIDGNRIIGRTTVEQNAPTIPLPAGFPLILSGVIALFGAMRLQRKSAV